MRPRPLPRGGYTRAADTAVGDQIQQSAFGIVSRLCLGLCEEEGPTVDGLPAKAAARGSTVQIRTVA